MEFRMDTQSQPLSIDELEQQQLVALFSISTVFPFHLFPTRLSVDKRKVNISKGIFFGSKQVQSMLIVDIDSVVVDTSALFAKLTIRDKLALNLPIFVDFLQKEEALKMRRVIEGLIVGDRSRVDLSVITDENLLPKLEQIGSSKTQA
jgi:hypothetical protein